MKPNFLFLVNDEEQHFDFYLSLVPPNKRKAFLAKLKARTWMLEQGVSFDNYHCTSTPCTSSRSVIWTGHHAPDTELVDNMELPCQISLGVYDPGVAAEPVGSGSLGEDYGPPALGHILEKLGYYPAYQGKVHLAQDSQMDSAEKMLKRYGFQDWSGTFPEITSQTADFEGPNMGHLLDPFIADKAVEWLKERAPELDKPWFLAVNFINPHDTMLVDIDGMSGGIQEVQSQSFPLLPVARSPLYQVWWAPLQPANFAPDFEKQDKGPRPDAHDFWSSICGLMFGNIPFDRECLFELSNGKSISVPIWQAMINHYLNCIIDNDRQMWKVIQTLLNEPRLAAAREQTLLVWTSDHGEMMMSHGGVNGFYQDAIGPADARASKEVWMPLRQKGPFVYRENLKVPFVVASPSRALIPFPSSRTAALSSHIDLVPSLIQWAGADSHWYQREFASYLRRLTPKRFTELPGRNLAPVAADPITYQGPAWLGRKEILFTYDAVNSMDPLFVKAFSENQEPSKINFQNRGCLRAFYDGNIKFGRYFSPLDYHSQFQLEGDYEQLNQPGQVGEYAHHGFDFVLFRTEDDPTEQNNLIEEAGKRGLPSLDELNRRLDALMKAELAEPERRVLTQQKFMDGVPWVMELMNKKGIPGFTEVTLIGAGFMEDVEVYFGGKRAFNILERRVDKLVVVMPLGAKIGPIEVRTSKGMFKTPYNFELRTAIQPATGPDRPF